MIRNYSPAFNKEAPDITLTGRGFVFDPDQRSEHRLADGSLWIFDSAADTSGFASLPAGSVMLSRQALHYRTPSRVKSFYLGNISVQNEKVTLAPAQVRAALDRYTPAALWLLGALVIVLLCAAILVLSLLMAGLGAIIDGFSNGPFDYSRLYHRALLILSLGFGAMVVLRPLGLRPLPLIFCYFVVLTGYYAGSVVRSIQKARNELI